MGFLGGSVIKNLIVMWEPQETHTQPLSRQDPMEEGMTTHSRILAQRIPWTEEPVELQFKGPAKESDMTQQLNNNNIYILFFFFLMFSSFIGDYKILSIFSCAIQQVLIDYLFYIQHCVYFNPKLLIYPFPPL